MSLTTKEILNFAKEIYTKQYSAAHLNVVNSEIFPKTINAILKHLETRVTRYENLKNSTERECGYRRLQLDAVVVISLIKYFYSNDKNDPFKNLINNDVKENFKRKVFKNFDQDDIIYLFISTNADLLIFTEILEKLGDNLAKERRFWLLFKFDEIAVKVINNVDNGTFNSFVLSTFDSDNFHKRLFSLMMFEVEKNLTFTQSLELILKGEDMPYTLAAASKVDSLEKLRKFFSLFK